MEYPNGQLRIITTYHFGRGKEHTSGFWASSGDYLQMIPIHELLNRIRSDREFAKGNVAGPRADRPREAKGSMPALASMTRLPSKASPLIEPAELPLLKTILSKIDPERVTKCFGYDQGAGLVLMGLPKHLPGRDGAWNLATLSAAKPHLRRKHPKQSRDHE